MTKDACQLDRLQTLPIGVRRTARGARFVIVIIALLTLPVAACGVATMKPPRIENTNGLQKFFATLHSTEQAEATTRIIHYGDSHVAADWLTGKLRHNFQQDFGTDWLRYEAKEINGVRAPGTANDARWRGNETNDLHLPKMNGRTVILHAVRKLTEAAHEILARKQLAMEQIELIVPHQANLNLLRTLGKKLEVNEDRIVVNVDRYGNTSGASAFTALAEAHQKKLLKPNARVLILAFGAGFTWGAALLRNQP